MKKEPVLLVSEIFLSLQGESSFAGLPCAFVRLSGCSHGCAWCDTRYASRGGRSWTLRRILRKVASFRVGLVEVTGGEPLEQEAVYPLLRALRRAGYRVLLETNGARDVKRVPRGVVKILDVKGPSSGREKRNLWSNLRRLGPLDEVKFVVADMKDYRFAKSVMRRFRLKGKNLLLSPLHGRMPPGRLASWVVRDRLPARVQLQLHKVIWGPDRRGR